ncbi:MAG: lysophospholipase [Phycisphaerae bacterium]|nr:lysophospholipase [Phycisphaerae bacterium]
MSDEGRFRSRDGLELFERRWSPGGEPRADLVLLHGYGEHCGRYAHVAAALNEIGVEVRAYDQRGHGRSPGKPGYICRFDALLDDLDAYIEHVRRDVRDRPLLLMGHSMGGLVLALCAETREVDASGLILSSPFLAINDDVSPVLIALAGVLGTLTPWLPVASLNHEHVARDPAVVSGYGSDPLVFHGKILARTGAQLNAAIARARQRFEAITLPVYVIHGGDDRLVPAGGSRLLYEQCCSDDKAYKEYEGGYHELMNDYGKEDVIAAMLAWVDAHL